MRKRKRKNRYEYGKKTPFRKKVKRFFIGLVLIAACGFVLWGGLNYLLTPDYSIDDVPEFSGEASVPINGNVPEFSKKEIRKKYFQKFSSLDRLDRCGPAVACVERSQMPSGERGPIGMIKPSGWQLEKYDFIDNGGYLFNRCHLIGWQLTGANDEVRNLVTGTRYMNVSGMLPYENQVADYVRETGNHVMYRATPCFRRGELVARGVQLEAYSVEDRGRGVKFNVYCYNVQPGVEIDYRTGESEAAD